MTSAVFTTMTMLERENIHFTIERTRPDTIRINATLVGERLEIDIFDDDHIEISRFYGNEDIEGDIKLLEKIISDYANHES